MVLETRTYEQARGGRVQKELAWIEVAEGEGGRVCSLSSPPVSSILFLPAFSPPASLFTGVSLPLPPPLVGQRRERKRTTSRRLWF